MTLGFLRAADQAMVKPTSPSTRTTVSPADVFVSWSTTAENAARQFASHGDAARTSRKRRRLGFFAMPPREHLQQQQMRQLERAGLRIVHVPANLVRADTQQVSQYLSHRLQKLLQSVSPLRPPRLIESSAVLGGGAALSESELLVDEEDGEQLEAINDPDNAIDDLT